MFNEHVYDPVKFVHDDARRACRKPKRRVGKPKWRVRIISESPRIMWPDSSWREVANEHRAHT